MSDGQGHRKRRTFQSRVKSKAANSDKQIAQVGHEKDRVVFIAVTIGKTFVGQIHEEHIGQAVYHFG